MNPVKTQEILPLENPNGASVSLEEVVSTAVEELLAKGNGHGFAPEVDPYQLARQLANAKTNGRHYQDDVLGDVLLAVAQGATDPSEIENAVRKSARREWKFAEVHSPLSEADDRQRCGPPERAQFGVSEEVDRLPTRQRQAVILVFWEGLTEEEAAQEMGCSHQTVHGYLNSAIAKLRKIFSSRTAKRPSPMPYISEGKNRIGSSMPAKCGQKGQPAC